MVNGAKTGSKCLSCILVKKKKEKRKEKAVRT